MEEVKTVYDEGLDFIRMIEKKKYCINEETNWEDIIQKRFAPIINKHFGEDDKDKIIKILLEKKFITGGGVTFGYGNNNVNCSLSNCYFTPINEDSIEGIMETVKEISKTYSYRGGTGIDITILRPKDSGVSNAALSSSGAVSFMPLYSEVTTTIGQKGRRGALIISIDCRHPDVLDFIWSKAKPEEIFGKDNLTGKVPDISGANISVKLTHKFMEAVKNDEDWELIFPAYKQEREKYDNEWCGDIDKWIEKGYPVTVYKTIKAREMLKQIAESSHLCGDPGIIFWDNVVKQSPGNFDNMLIPKGVNPCSEQSLANYGNCLLGAINLPKYVSNKWTDVASFDIELLRKDIKYIVKFMDHLIDVNTHPLPQQTETDMYGRRIGIEVTGVGDVLAMLNLKYNSKEARNIVSDIQREISTSAILESIEVAKEKGCCPALKSKESRMKFINTAFMSRIIKDNPEIKNLILEHGIRNTDWTTLGPTGTVSMIGDNCTSGIEPLYALEYFRETRLEPGKQTRIIHFPLLKYGVENNIYEGIMEMTKEEIKEKYNYVEAFEIDYIDRIKLQGQVQKYVSSSISSTINLPTDITPEEMYSIYIEAWNNKLKGVTVFREGCKKGVLSIKKEEKEIKTVYVGGGYEKELLNEEKSIRHRILWKGKAKVYLNVSIDEDGTPLELFTRMPKEVGMDEDGIFDPTLYLEKMSLWDGICRMISVLLRRNIELNEIIEQLDKSSYGMYDLTSIISRILKQYPRIVDEEDEDEKREYYKQVLEQKLGEKCPSCNEMTLIREGTCEKCMDCGYDKCA